MEKEIEIIAQVHRILIEGSVNISEIMKCLVQGTKTDGVHLDSTHTDCLFRAIDELVETLTLEEMKSHQSRQSTSASVVQVDADCTSLARCPWDIFEVDESLAAAAVICHLRVFT